MFQLYTPNRRRIVARKVTVDMHQPVSGFRLEHGEITPDDDFYGDSHIDWATLRPATYEGERIYIDQDGEEWNENQLTSELTPQE
jgi:hypothetical protein